MAIKFEATADFAQVIAENAKLQKAVQTLQDKVGDLTKAGEQLGYSHAKGYSTAAVAAQSCTKAAQELGTQGKLAAAAYQAQVSTLNEQLRAGTITKQEFARQVGRAKDALVGETAAIRDQQAEQQKLKGWSDQVAEAVRTGAEKQLAYVAKLKQAWQSGALSTEDYKRAVAAASSQGAELPGPLAAARSEVIGMVTGLAAGFTSISGILGTVQQLREEAKAIRGQQLQKQLTMAESQGEVQKMIGDVDAAPFIKKIEDMTVEAKFGDAPAAMQASADVLSATRGNTQTAESVMRYAMPLQRNKPADLPAVAGAIADTARAMGATSDEEIKQAAALVVSTVGQARITSYQAFREAATSLNVGEAANTKTEKVESVRESAALWAGLSQRMVDPEGAQTKTAFAGVVTTLEKMFPEQDKIVSLDDGQRAELESKRLHLQKRVEDLGKEATAPRERQQAEKTAIDLKIRDLDKEISTGQSVHGKHKRLTDTQLAEATAQRAELTDRRKKLEEPKRSAEVITADRDKTQAELEKVEQKLTGEKKKGTGLKDTWSRMQAMWESPEAQAEFKEKVEKSGFRGPVKLIVRGLADSQSDISKEMRATMAGTSVDTKSFDRMIARLGSGTAPLAMKTEQAGMAASISQFDVANTTGTRREAMERMLYGTGPDEGVMTRAAPQAGWMSSFAEKTFGSGVNALQRLRGVSEEQIGIDALVDRRKDIVPNAPEREMSQAGYIPQGATEDQIATLKLIDDAIKMLRQREERFNASTQPSQAVKQQPAGEPASEAQAVKQQPAGEPASEGQATKQQPPAEPASEAQAVKQESPSEPPTESRPSGRGPAAQPAPSASESSPSSRPSEQQAAQDRSLAEAQLRQQQLHNEKLDRLADVLTNQPRSGSSTAAPTLQRQSR